jgi:hypothetical protein
VREPLQQPDEGERDREGRECEVRACEARRDQPECEPERPGDDAGDRNRPEIAPAVVDDEDRRRVRADADERAVTERDLAREAGQDVQPEESDQVDRDETEL